MLRKFFDVYILKEMNTGKFVNIRKGFVNKLEEGSNFFIIAWSLPFICNFMNWYNDKYYFVIKRIWMPNIRIDATITPDLMKRYFNEDE